MVCIHMVEETHSHSEPFVKSLAQLGRGHLNRKHSQVVVILIA
ncbi:hypothetical protein 16Q_162 [Pseudomonas phage 16Q]|nr:hypothetical protein 16Q_162 [Pseudomonas phage 16Q]